MNDNVHSRVVNTEGKREPTLKGHSRVLKACHWCAKKQEPEEKPFQACARCKEVLYCSKECQVKSWPFHKATCNMSVESKKGLGGNPEQAGSVAQFKKWHAHHVNLLKHAAICALDLGNNPSNLDNNLLLIEFELKSNHLSLPYQEKYEPKGGFKLTTDEAKSMLGGMPNGVQMLEAGKENHEFMKKKGGLGIVTMLLMANKMCDITRIVMPSPEMANISQQLDNWGENWLERLTQQLRLPSS